MKNPHCLPTSSPDGLYSYFLSLPSSVLHIFLTSKSLYGLKPDLTEGLSAAWAKLNSGYSETQTKLNCLLPRWHTPMPWLLSSAVGLALWDLPGGKTDHSHHCLLLETFYGHQQTTSSLFAYASALPRPTCMKILSYQKKHRIRNPSYVN